MAGWGTMRRSVEHTHMLGAMGSHLSFPNVLISEIYITYVSPCYRWLTAPSLTLSPSLSFARALSLALSTFCMLSLVSTGDLGGGDKVGCWQVESGRMCSSALLPLARAAVCAEWLHLALNAPEGSFLIGSADLGGPVTQAAFLEILANARRGVGIVTGELSLRGKRRWRSVVAAWAAVVAGDAGAICHVEGAGAGVHDVVREPAHLHSWETHTHTPGLVEILVRGGMHSPPFTATAHHHEVGHAGAAAQRIVAAHAIPMVLALIDTAQDIADGTHAAHALCAATTLAAATLVLHLHLPPPSPDSEKAEDSNALGEPGLFKKEEMERVIGLVEGLEAVVPQLQKSEQYWLIKLRLALLSQPPPQCAAGEGSNGRHGAGGRGGVSQMAEEDNEIDMVWRLASDACNELPESSVLVRWRLALLTLDSDLAARTRLSTEARALGVCV